MATGQEMSKLEGHGGTVSSVAISPDGKTIVSGSYDSTIR
jgi:WD40 repeat protein